MQQKIVLPEAEPESEKVLERFSDSQSQSDYDDFARCSVTPSIAFSSAQNLFAELGFPCHQCCLPITGLTSHFNRKPIKGQF